MLLVLLYFGCYVGVIVYVCIVCCLEMLSSLLSLFGLLCYAMCCWHVTVTAIVAVVVGYIRR